MTTPEPIDNPASTEAVHYLTGEPAPVVEPEVVVAEEGPCCQDGEGGGFGDDDEATRAEGAQE